MEEFRLKALEGSFWLTKIRNSVIYEKYGIVQEEFLTTEEYGISVVGFLLSMCGRIFQHKLLSGTHDDRITVLLFLKPPFYLFYRKPQIKHFQKAQPFLIAAFRYAYTYIYTASPLQARRIFTTEDTEFHGGRKEKILTIGEMTN